jgi:hypothetical protein
LDVLAKLGLSYDDLTTAALNAPKPQDVRVAQLEEKLKQYEAKASQEAEKVARRINEEQQTMQYQQALGQIRNEAKSLIENDPQFEMVKTTDSVADVVELIEKTFQREGVLLSVEDAAQAVEDYLTDEALRFAKVSKIQQKLATALAPKQPAAPAPKPTEKSTLTNSMGAQRQLSARERAILAAEGKLNKS